MNLSGNPLLEIVYPKVKEIITHKLRSILLKCNEYLSLGLSAANSTQESRQGLLEQIGQEHQSLSNIQNEIRLITIDLKKRLQAEFSETFEGQHARVSKDLLNQLKEDMPGWKGHLEKTSNDFRDWVEINFTIKLKPISEEYGPQLSNQYLNTAIESYSRIVRAFQDRLAQGIEKALHIQFDGARFEVKIQEPKRPDVHIGKRFYDSLGNHFVYYSNEIIQAFGQSSFSSPATLGCRV